MNEKKNTEAELIAYCGLYCGDCLRYRSKVTQLAADLMSELQVVRFNKYAEVKSAAVKELEGYDECLQVLGAIVKLGCDTPCRAGGDGCSRPCEIKRCDKFEFFKPIHGDTTKGNLRKIKEYGLNRWVEHREKFYSWL